MVLEALFFLSDYTFQDRFKEFTVVFRGEAVWTQGHLEVVLFACFQPAYLHDPKCSLEGTSRTST